MRPIPIDMPLPAIGTEESERLDFKLDGYGGTEQNKREAAADLAQFANHLGGRLILGADEDDEKVNAYPGLADINEHEQRIQDVAQALLDPRPDVVTRRAQAPGAAQGAAEVLVVTIQPFSGVVAVRYQGGDPKYRFPVRVGKSKRYMTFSEVVWPSSSAGEHTISLSCALTNKPDENRVLVQQHRKSL